MTLAGSVADNHLAGRPSAAGAALLPVLVLLLLGCIAQASWYEVQEAVGWEIEVTR